MGASQGESLQTYATEHARFEAQNQRRVLQDPSKHDQKISNAHEGEGSIVHQVQGMRF